MATWTVAAADLLALQRASWRPRTHLRSWSCAAPAPDPAFGSSSLATRGARPCADFPRAGLSEPSVGGFDRAALGNARLSVRVRAASNASGDSSDPHVAWLSDPNDAPTRIDPPHGYSHGDDLESLRIDEHERKAWWVPARDPGGFVNDVPGTPSSFASASGPGSYAWPPPLGRGWVARFARAAWALVAALGAFRAAWRCFGVVLFLAPESAAATPAASALDAALRESLAGLAQGALVGLVLAPAAAAAMAWLFEIVLRVLEGLAAPGLARTLAPATAKTEKDRAARAMSCPPDATRTTRSRDSKPRRMRRRGAANRRETCVAGMDAPRSRDRARRGGVAAAAGSRATRRRAWRAPARGVRVRGGGDGAASARRWSHGGERARGDGGARARISRRTARGTFLCRWRADDYAAPGRGTRRPRTRLNQRRRRSRGRERSLARCACPPRLRSSWTPRMGGPPPRCLPRRRSVRGPPRRRRRRRRRWFRGRLGSGRSGEVAADQAPWLEDAFPDFEDASASFDEAAEDDASFADDPSVAFEQSVSFGFREREKGDRLAAFGFPPAAVFVPNQHTHVVRALRRAAAASEPKCSAYAADVRDVLARRRPTASPFHLVYLDHCGAGPQREQQIWDIFSRHAVAGGGVVAVTFSTRGSARAGAKPRPWPPARACSSRPRTRTATSSGAAPRTEAGARPSPTPTCRA